jgi:mannan endo-1,4-beta-mannosidase
MLGSRQFRFSGSNIEWLGLVGYGPLNFTAWQNETYPTHYEIDDALATAKATGATVIRAQTLGDTVGCGNCLEPTLGHFNAQAFDVMDYAVARARADGIRLIFEFLGDARAEDVSSTADIFSTWAAVRTSGPTPR